MRKNTKYLNSKLIIVAFLSLMTGFAQTKTVNVDAFDKVTVSPHIQVIFQEGDTESVAIESNSAGEEKLNIEVQGKTLRIYLDGAKEVTKNEKTNENGYKRKKSIYNGTIVKATVTYKNLEELSLRGEEKFICESTLTGDKFRLTIYGESQVYLNSVALGNLHTAIYGESYLELKNGTIDYQKITAYGETKVNTMGVKSSSAKITTYGEGSYRLQVSNDLKITAFGEATIAYTGDPKVKKGMIIGEATIQQIQ